MPDSPDYSKFLGTSVRFSLQDLGELAARLGSLSSFDRRGEIVYIEDWRKGIASWVVQELGTGASVRLSTTQTHKTPYSIQFISGSSSSKTASITSSTGGNIDGRLGIECGFIVNNATEQIHINAAVNNGTLQTLARLKWDIVTGELSLFVAGSTYTLLDDRLWTSGGTFRFYPVKFVFDIATGKYTRLMISSLSFDLSGYDLVQSATTTNPLYSLSIQHIADTLTNPVLYNNYVILTANEP